ncbi:class I SAM-dependent methyltransferase [Marinivivus vitaminiproducens]|uniref:class I SAM-dependent methyltransferase n=1 Tax=Marinivivus vitaminiproducens TaxID=3035935 RepID=UPI0027998452|nr:class I SAM-dependent methyltransferase [Geminicoccaceae bacterium SCSIO 64248]
MAADRWADFWDERYDGEAFLFGENPNRFLREQAARIRQGGTVLAPADGEGRNGVWLAEQGFDVTTFDLSPKGVAKAEGLARAHGVRLKQAIGDAMTWPWPESAFDAVALVFFLLPPEARRHVHRKAQAALRPGGLLILECYRPEQILRGLTSGGPKDIRMLPDKDTLAEDFAGLETVLIEEADPVLDEGSRHSGLAATLRYVGRRAG